MTSNLDPEALGAANTTNAEADAQDKEVSGLLNALGEQYYI